MTGRAPWPGSLARTYAAWERFVAGEERPEDVPLGIATSWYRCRDVYRIDPRHSPTGTPEDGALYGPVHATLFAELGGLAAALAVRHDDCLTVVTDGRGRLVSSHGSGATGRRARDVGDTPIWAETVAGTNAVGTALVHRQATGVRGPEHWNSSLHDWSCSSVALCDAVTGTPLASLAMSAWQGPVPLRPVDLVVETRPLGCVLRRAAARDRARLVAAFGRLELGPGTSGAALDASGRVVVANAAFRARHRWGADSPADPADPDAPGDPDVAGLARLAERVRAGVRGDPDWRGTVLGDERDDDGEPYHLVPVMAGPEAVGFLAAADPGLGRGEPVSPGEPARPGRPACPGEPVPPREPSGPGAPVRPGAEPDTVAAGPGRRDRVPALTGSGQLVLLPVAGIRHARADGHTVWLTTDDGVLRAARRGIDHLERDLRGEGFLRVHRSYLVNLARVRELSSERGGLTLSTAPRRHERIPVSRRFAPTVRRRLGL
ncbi:LytTR family transcriptional regulator DNA-binding domain-containing protein [Actinomycetospora endophytica]|uniref:LytTR family transcriptional regulator DNA-binding domain-containing protein n=1 Tax=Actinomycetospora endophytica TaxID=2291215 RepID=A0ABS8P2F0_9PSEU|nr:DNA-binding protein [Actinomycetospora endophytica]MCD2192172.1 LytTR family transcriptional regulator DNA-binding domain-containing protein [Actinomycetospora endophytica]